MKWCKSCIHCLVKHQYSSALSVSVSLLCLYFRSLSSALIWSHFVSDRWEVFIVEAVASNPSVTAFASFDANSEFESDSSDSSDSLDRNDNKQSIQFTSISLRIVIWIWNQSKTHKRDIDFGVTEKIEFLSDLIYLLTIVTSKTLVSLMVHFCLSLSLTSCQPIILWGH